MLENCRARGVAVPEARSRGQRVTIDLQYSRSSSAFWEITSFGYRQYVPCLRWKQGEYKAVSLVSNGARDLITPLIEIPEKGFDFETWADKKTIDEHLKPVASG